MPAFDQIDHAVVTDVGIRRSHNQDAYSVQRATNEQHWNTVGHIFMVADGMGGHAVGEKASAKAVQDIPLTYVKHAHEGPPAALRRAFEEANAGIYSVGQSNPEFRGMGTTSTVMVLRSEGAWIGHVGDSRVYRVREGKIEQLSFDHSYAWEMARRLGIPPEDLSDVKKNVIIRSLGPDTHVQVDIEGPYPVLPGDIFVLCSDGLSNPVSPEEIGMIVTALPSDESARFLVELANLRGGPDNITVIVVRIGGTSPENASTALHVVHPIRPWKIYFRRTLEKWKQKLPWPILVLTGGLLLTIVFLIFAVFELPGRTALFALAAVSILAGLVGLILQHRKKQYPQSPEYEIPPKLNIYREYDCRIDRHLIEKLMKMENQLREQLELRKLSVDLTRVETLHRSAEEELQSGNLLASFRDECRALLDLAQVLNKSKHKEEGFRPKWESTAG